MKPGTVKNYRGQIEQNPNIYNMHLERLAWINISNKKQGGGKSSFELRLLICTALERRLHLKVPELKGFPSKRPRSAEEAPVLTGDLEILRLASGCPNSPFTAVNWKNRYKTWVTILVQEAWIPSVKPIPRNTPSLTPTSLSFNLAVFFKTLFSLQFSWSVAEPSSMTTDENG